MKRNVCYLLFAFLTTGLMFWAGCSDSVAVQTESASRDVDFVPIAVPADSRFAADLRPDAAPTARKAALDALAETDAIGMEGLQILEKARSWSEAHRKIQALLETHAGHPGRFNFEQRIGNRMLHTLIQAATSPQRNAAIAFYTERLLSHHHADASVLLPALQTLNDAGYWPEARIASASAIVADDATAWLARQTQRLPSAEKTGPVYDARNAALQQRIDQIQQALQRLSNS